MCSARSGSTKDLGTTSLLLKAAGEAKQRPPKSHCRSDSDSPATNGIFGRSSEPHTPRTRSSSPTSLAFTFTPLSNPQSAKNEPDFVATVDLIRSEHLTAAQASIKTPDILQEIEAEINRDCDWLRAFLFAAQVWLFVNLHLPSLSHPLRHRSSMKSLLDLETVSLVLESD